MKILSIGNSFSTDAQRYLHRVAKSEGINLKTANLFIGGCSLRTHYINVLEDNAHYIFGFNGEDTGLKVSVKQALISDEWDVVTIQQASHYSVDESTYFPYAEEVVNYVKKYCPNAKIYVHQTWAYENGSDRLLNVARCQTSEEMFKKLECAYDKMAKAVNADGIIPCGRVMLNASLKGVKVHRDTFHASFGFGRYMLALTWLKTLTGCDISNNVFDEFDEPVSEQERAIAISAVNDVLGKN